MRLALLVVVLVPLVGFGLTALASARDANHTATAAMEVRQDASEVKALTTYQAALYVEHFWAGASDAVDQLGVSSAEMVPVLGYDVQAELGAARDQVDRLAPPVPDSELAALLSTARLVGATPNGRLGPYGEAERRLDDLIHGSLDDLRRATSSVTDTAEVASGADVLVAAVDVRRQVFLLTANLFGTKFPDQAVTGDPRVGLIAALGGYRDAWARLRSLVGDEEPMASALQRVAGDARSVALLGSADRAVGESLLPVAPPEGEAALAVADFADALAVLGSYVQVVSDAADQVVERAGVVAVRAEDERRQLYLGLGLVTVVTVGILVVVGRWIVGSVDGIAVSASAMDRGDLDRPAPVRGPLEVRAAARALNAAASHLRSAERQALALADGDLPPGSTGSSAPSSGAMGRSMQQAMASLTASLQEREELRRRLQHEALHDGLTGLPNRTSIVAGLDAALADRRGRSGDVAVLFIDCDGFKLVNDQHGHAAGDRVLCAIADRILDSVRGSDLVGRLGGDEFVVVADPIGGEREARALAGRIRAAIRQPIETEASSVTPAVSIGVAIGGAGTEPAQLLHDADLAVYEAKSLGAGAIEVCGDELRRAAADRQSVEVQLRQAIEDDELRVHFQPIVSWRDGRTTGYEALVRWPEGLGMDRSPIEFVTVAERSDLIVRLDEWVIEHTVALLGDPTGPLGAPDTKVSVNLSARHASTRPFAAHILGALDRAGVPTHRLVVELTESALLADVDRVVTQLQRLRDRGVRIALDDFGTGYTSLSLLHRLPIDTLKLDRALTAGLDRTEVAAVVKLIVDTAHLIGLGVVAEGIETVEQARALEDLGVDELQGFLFARPGPVDDLPVPVLPAVPGAR